MCVPRVSGYLDTSERKVGARVCMWRLPEGALALRVNGIYDSGVPIEESRVCVNGVFRVCGHHQRERRMHYECMWPFFLKEWR